MFYANEQLKLNSLKGTKVTDKIREIAANWNAFSEKQKQKYDEFSKKDNERYQNQLTDLRKKGFFMTDDGKKSSDLPKKIIKARKPPTKK